MKLVVTIEMEIEDALVVGLPAAQENLIDYAVKAVKTRLFGQGFMPDDIEIDRWSAQAHWASADTWSEHPYHTVAAWQYEVENDDTRLGYWAWVANQPTEEPE